MSTPSALTGPRSPHADAQSSAGGVELSFDNSPTTVEARPSAGGVTADYLR